MRPITLIVPEGSMLNPRYPAAVVAGNVETSQVITDACSPRSARGAPRQGTMNNFTFGNGELQYYETIARRRGRGPGFDGASAVQTHMTNSRLDRSRNTGDALSGAARALRHPARLGRARDVEGGDGVVRQIRFLEPMSAAILSNRRRVAPFGLERRRRREPGRNAIIRADGTVEILGATAVAEMQPGDVFVIETPGGGGFGAPEAD